MNTRTRITLLNPTSLALLCLLLLQNDPATSFSLSAAPLSRTATSLKSAAPPDIIEEDFSTARKTVVVIGGGWAGFTAADALAETKNCNVILLDASPRGPGGLAGAGWKTPKLGFPVEAGIHGFWREYRNTFRLVQKIIGEDSNSTTTDADALDLVLTPYTPSVLVSESGRVAVAPVLQTRNEESSSPRSTWMTGSIGDFRNLATSFLSLNNNNDPASQPEALKRIGELLPPPLDVALLADYTDSKLTVADRLSGLGMLGAWSDFQPDSDASWKRYDTISADQLFRNIAGVSSNMYRDLVAPLLHVLPMTAGYDCSAAAALSCFHVFALQARGAFDVRWCRGSIAEKIFNPWVERLVKDYHVDVRGSSKVTAITEIESRENGSTPKKLSLSLSSGTNSTSDTLVCDAVVLAIGATAAGRLVDTCPPAVQHRYAASWKQLRGVTCVAVRLFFEAPPSSDTDIWKRAMDQTMPESPVVVCGPNILPELAETGFCIYDLTRMQDDIGSRAADRIYGLEVDFFRADGLADLANDQDVIAIALRAVQASLNWPADISLVQDHSDNSNNALIVVDAAVVRARKAVSHFCVGSASHSPPIRLLDDNSNMYACGDWVDRTGHASWSTEKAVVTGLQAARACADDLGIIANNIIPDVIPSAADTAPLTALRQVAKAIRTVTPPNVLPLSPWSFLGQQQRQ